VFRHDAARWAGELTPQEQRALDMTFGEGIYEVTEAGARLFVIPKLRLPVGADPSEAFAIYHASPYSGYTSRLFFEIAIKGANGSMPPVTTAVLCGRTVHAASFNGVPAELPPHQAILAHLRLYEAP
jgi:hypothetical protein